MKSKDKYQWIIGQPPPPLDPHTQVKHQLVYDYVCRYIQVLMSNANIPVLKLSLIDGFAGGGQYTSADGIAPGSPLLLLQAVQEAQTMLNIGRQNRRQIEARYYFVDMEASTHEYLDHVLAAEGYRARVGNDIQLFHSSFDGVCESIVSKIQAFKGGQRSLFLLDQYAYDDIPMHQIRTIFQRLQGAEVILTFNVDSLVSFLTDSPACRGTMRRLGLEQYINWEGYESLKKHAQWRPIIQQQLANGILQASTAKYMTLFFVTPQGNTPWSYWLVHLSNKFKARDVMMSLHWEHGNSFGHSLDPGLFQIGYEANSDDGVTKQCAFTFGDAHAFDSLLRERCIRSLSIHLPKLLHRNENGIPFSYLMAHIGNRTTATTLLVKEALDFSVKTGEITVQSRDGAIRVKGASIRDSDILIPSRQRIFLFPKHD